jgi:hypothetical protein
MVFRNFALNLMATATHLSTFGESAVNLSVAASALTLSKGHFQIEHEIN